MRAELERVQHDLVGEQRRREPTETAHLKARLTGRGARIEDLQRVPTALVSALERADLTGLAVPAQGGP